MRDRNRWLSLSLAIALVAVMTLPAIASGGFTQPGAMIYWEDAFEPDDTFAQAKPAQAMSYHTFHEVDDEDIVYVDALAGDIFSAETLFGESSNGNDVDYGDFDTELEVWSRVGGSGEMTVVAGNDDHPWFWETYSSSLIFKAPWAGRYYINAHEYTPDDRGSYYLYVNKGLGRRVYGANRYETAAWVSRTAWPANHIHDGNNPNYPENVVVASGENFADAVAGAALAAAMDGQILITAKNYLPGVIEDEIDRLGSAEEVYWDEDGLRVFLMGGTAAVSESTARSIAGMRWVQSFERVWGSDRFETAAAIAEVMADEEGMPGTVYVVNGWAWPDALTIAPVAGWNDWPILLCNTGDIPQATEDFITDNSITDAIIIGGTSVVNAAAKTELESLVSGTVTRIGGATRYETARLVAEHAVDDGGMGAELMTLASGANWPDALCSATLAYVAEAPLLLTPTTGLSPEVKTFMDDYSIPFLETDYDDFGNNQAYFGPMSYAIGGPGALPNPVFNAWADYY